MQDLLNGIPLKSEFSWYRFTISSLPKREKNWHSLVFYLLQCFMAVSVLVFDSNQIPDT